jgi:exodeoxyribonuclease III
MKIVSYNVNGIRSALSKGLKEYLIEEDPDIICIQEIKADDNAIPRGLFESVGYHEYWFPAQKKGYSGTAIFSKIPAIRLENGIRHLMFDNEGRVMTAQFESFSLINAYFPSGTTGEERQKAKMEFLESFLQFAKETLQKGPVIIVGDFNICHKSIDIHDPVRNKNTSGFLPEERAWMDVFFESGLKDTFRALNPNPHHYSWWTYRAGARENNKGWRIDYIAVSDGLYKYLKRAEIRNLVVHSDHCPITAEFDGLK